MKLSDKDTWYSQCMCVSESLVRWFSKTDKSMKRAKILSVWSR